MTEVRSASRADADDRLGQRIAERYRLVERIGAGGMATVYLARDEQLDRDVALKAFRQELASADDLRRQQGEIRILARLAHPSLVTLYDAVADEDGRAALILEYVPGSDVRARIARGPLPARSVAAIGHDVARALAHIHAQGIVHRDIAPGNILLPDTGAEEHGVAAKLTDLGIARLVDDARTTATGGIIGTAHYLSPEQAQGRPLTPASDIYSLGIVLLECLTGERAFPGSAMESALARISHDPAIPSRLDASWRELLAAMTERDPECRPDATEVAASLARLVTPQHAETTAAQDVETAPMPTAAGWTDPTRRLPSAAGTLTRTRVLPPAGSLAAGPGTTRRPRRPGRRLQLLLLLLALVVLAAIILVPLLAQSGTGIPEPAPSYPAVPGQLGEHLQQLEQDVSPDSS